jgi:3-phosphoshikimate 1-carboxyvinyltransferase
MSEVRRLVVIGTGLVGGSVAAAARGAGFTERVVGVDADPAALEAGLGAGLLDATGLPEDLGPDDLVVLAVPTLAVPGALEELVDDAGVLAGGAVVTDTASVKGTVVAALQGLPPAARARFVPGHPIAGSERSGIGAARPDLFRGHRVLLTPEPGTAPEAVARVEGLWRAAGAEVLRMDVAEHDRILAMTSHLPHLLAFALVDTLGAQREHEEIFRHAAGGFRDFTRIASSDPVMWRDVFAANGPAVLSILDRFVADLGRLRAQLEAGDRDALHETFTRAKALRDAHVGIGTRRG